MAINYNPSAIEASSINPTDSLIQNINSLSPKTSPVPTQAGNSSSLFGMNSGDASNAFDSAYSKATAGYAPFPDTGTQGDINQLQDVYNKIPAAYDVSGTLSAMNAARGASLTTGQQASNTAANKFAESQQPGQYTGAGASVLRAQSLLPFMTADTQAAQSEGQYADTARQTALTTAASVAAQIAQLQQSYTNSLASYNSSKASFGLGYANDSTGLQLQASQNNTNAQLSALQSQNQLAEQAREANLSAALNQNNSASQAAQTATNQQISAANSFLTNSKAPSGSWTTGPTGQVLSGQSDYDAYQNYLASRTGVAGTLAKLAF